MKKNSGVVALIIILLVFLVALIGAFIYLLRNNDGFSFEFKTKEMNLIDSIEKNTNEVNNIKFDLGSIDVEIKESENDTVKIEYYSSKESDDKFEFDNNAIIFNESNSVCFGICNNRKKIIVYLSNSYIGDLDFELKSGDVSSKLDLSNSKISIKSSSGDIILNKVGNVTMSTSSGDVKIDSIVDGNITTSSGDVKINDVSNSLNLKTTSGDILITSLDTNKKSSISTTSGDVAIISLNIKEDSSIDTTSGDVTITENLSKCYIQTKTTSGDSFIANNYRKSDIVLDVRTTSGDIFLK